MYFNEFSDPQKAADNDIMFDPAWPAENNKQVADWVTDIEWSQVGTQMGNAIYDGLSAIGETIKAWFMGLIPDWAQDWFGSGSPETSH